MTEDERICPLTHADDLPRRSASGTELCGGHISKGLAALEQLPERWVDLASVAVPSGQRSQGPRSAEKPIPYREKASDLRYGGSDPDRPAVEQVGIRNTLTGWAQVVSEERGMPLPVKPELETQGPQCWALVCTHQSCRRIAWEIQRGQHFDTRTDVDLAAEYLRRHHDWSIRQTWAKAYTEEITDLNRMAWNVLHPNPVRRVDVPVPCPVCAGPLVALIGQYDAVLQRDDLAPPTVQCDGCGTIVPFADCQRGASTKGRMVTWEVCVLWADVHLGHRLPAATLRTWAARGLVATRKRERDVVYNLADVEKLLIGERVA